MNGTYGDNWGMLLAKRFFKSFEVELLTPKVCDKPWLMSNMEILEVSRKTLLIKAAIDQNTESIEQYSISFKC